MNLGDDDGYSLLEILVALALTAMIAAMIVQTTKQLRPLRQIQANYDSETIANRLVEVMAQDLQAALALPLSGLTTRQPMIGALQAVRFMAVVKTGFGTEGLREVTYTQETEPDGTLSLVRKIALRRFGAADNPALVQADELFDRGVSLKFQYLRRDQDGVVVWSDLWDRPDELPLAIRVDLGVVGATAARTVALTHD